MKKGRFSLVEAQLAQLREQIKTLTQLLENFINLPIKKLIYSLLFCLCRKKLFQTDDFIAINEKLDDWAKGYELEGAKILLSLTAGKKRTPFLNNIG